MDTDALAPHAIEQANDNSGKWTKHQKVILALLTPTAFSAALCFSVIAPFFPEEALRKGASEWEAGLILSIYELMGLFFSPLFGKHFLTIGSKFLIVSGVSGLAITFILFGTLNLCSPGMQFIVLAFILRMTQGISASAMSTSAYTIAAQEFPNEVSSVVGIMEFGMAMAFTIGPPIGGLLYEAGGFMMPFAVVGGCNLITAVALLVFMPSQKDVAKTATSSFFKLLIFPEVWLSIMTILVMTIALTFLDLTLSQHLCQFDLTPGQKSMFFMIVSFFYGISCPFWGKLADRKFWSRRVMTIGAIMNGFSLLSLGPPPFLMKKSALWMIGLSLGFVGLGMGAQFLPPFVDILTTITHDGSYPNNLQTHALISGLCNAAYPLGSFIGPTIGGVMYDSIGFGWSLTLIGGLELLLALIFFASYLAKRFLRNCKEGTVPYVLVTEGKSESDGNENDLQGVVC